jgi:hypothetical protein
MVRLLQIIGVTALVFAGLVLASIKWPVAMLHLGLSQDREAQEFLDASTAVTRFNSRQDNQAADNQDKTPLLVRQAQTLEGIINPRVPPPVPTAAATASQAPAAPKPLAPSSAKFALVGVSFSPTDPASSFAYIRLADNITYQWIQQGSEIGHLIIKQVKTDSIICSDGQRLSEMTIEPTVDTASILETGAVAAAPAVSDRLAGTSSPLSARLTGQDEASLNDLVHRLKKELGKAPKADQADANTAPADKAAAVGKLITEYKSSRVSPEEAQKLDNLGEQLNGANDKQPNEKQQSDKQQMEEKRRELMRRMGQPRSPKQ